MNLHYDKDGKIMVWKIDYCGWVGPKELLDPSKPFTHAYISAPSAAEAVSTLKSTLRLPKIDVVGEPSLELMTQEEYDNG